MNFGIIDKLKSTLNSSTLIATIHNSLKDEDKFGIPAGSIGTALEKLAFITLAIKKPDVFKKHLVVFKNTKAEYTDSTNKTIDYSTEKPGQILIEASLERRFKIIKS